MKDQKTVVISGCTRGLGKAMAEGFLELGWHVAGCGRGQGGDGYFFRRVDVVDADAVEAFASEVVAELGVPDLVVNNAALINTNAPLWEVRVDEFSALMDVNLKGVFHVCRAFLPGMIEVGGGVVVNFSSGWGRSTSPEVAPYCCSKWGIEGLTAALAQELPGGVAAVALNPGVIDTEMLRSCMGDGAAGHRTAEQWAATAVPFLAGLGAGDNGRALTAP
ncbi:MAG: SDR family NAD(P)-dependent oxidoreductase [Verrucomicrobiales bacterium]|nr:SDR family NAD(P)-dependent oxidoreductase [Verrucomicrobiales bacterium]